MKDDQSKHNRHSPFEVSFKVRFVLCQEFLTFDPLSILSLIEEKALNCDISSALTHANKYS